MTDAVTHPRDVLPGVADLAAAYRQRRTDPVAICSTLLDRIGRINTDLNAYTEINNGLLAAAEESLRRLQEGRPRSLLEGVPLAIKDNLVVAGLHATWGGRVFGAMQSAHDELPVARLRAAGALIVGMTNTPEFSVDGHSRNLRYGATPNPWNRTLTPGGSSSGTVAAVAAGLAVAGIGTDGGGSIRRPAGYCGLYGLKPGIGTVPRGGGLPQLLRDFETVGPVARHARDLGPLTAALSGPEPVKSHRMGGVFRERGRPLRILHVPRLGDHPCDSGILACCRAAADDLARAGHHVTEGALPLPIDRINGFWPNWSRIALANLVARLPDMVLASEPYLAMARDGAAIPATGLLSALEDVAALRAAAERLFTEIDIIAMPASAAQPWSLDLPFPPVIDGVEVGPRGHAIYTGWVNAAGLPAVSIPVGPHPDGMPVGMQLIGAMGSEGTLIGLAEDHDAARVWRWPPVATG